MPRVLASTAVLVAAALVVLSGGRDADDETSVVLPPATPTATEAAPRPEAELSVESNEAAAGRRLRELNAMSETFRNTTFLVAIRDAGFICRELLGVYGGVNDSTTWTASCSEMLAYTIRIAGAGALSIEPMLEHSDSVTPSVQRDTEPRLILPPPNR